MGPQSGDEEPLSRTAGEGAERSEAGEGVATERPSPSHRCAMGPSLSRGAGEGFVAPLAG